MRQRRRMIAPCRLTPYDLVIVHRAIKARKQGFTRRAMSLGGASEDGASVIRGGEVIGQAPQHPVSANCP
jgi:hypothetical protein